jgi:hypothetical protein
MPETSVASEPAVVEEKTTETKPESEVATAAATNGSGDEQPATNGSDDTTNGDSKEEKKEDVKEMKSIVLMNFGGFKGVKILKKPEPSAQSGEVLIRVRSW